MSTENKLISKETVGRLTSFVVECHDVSESGEVQCKACDVTMHVDDNHMTYITECGTWLCRCCIGYHECEKCNPEDSDEEDEEDEEEKKKAEEEKKYYAPKSSDSETAQK